MPDQAISLDDIHRLIGQLTLENALLRKVIADSAAKASTQQCDDTVSRKVLSDTKFNPVSDIASPPPPSKGNGRPYGDVVDERI